MTKEELARKKGVKLTENKSTPAETLLTESIRENNTEKKAKSGRPKGKPSVKVSLNIPEEYIEFVRMISAYRYRGNTSSYIVSLIENDINSNKEVYEQIRRIIG